MTEVTVRVGTGTEVTVVATTEGEARVMPKVARAMGELAGYDCYYYSDVAWEIAEGTPEDVLADRELARMGAKLGITEDTDEWEAMCSVWWALVEKAQEEYDNLTDEEEETEEEEYEEEWQKTNTYCARCTTRGSVCCGICSVGRAKGVGYEE